MSSAPKSAAPAPTPSSAATLSQKPVAPLEIDLRDPFLAVLLAWLIPGTGISTSADGEKGACS